jgi:hypothetical protein
MLSSCNAAGGLAVRVQLPYTPPTDGPVSAAALAADPAAARAADLRARGKALVARRRQKQLEDKEGQLAAMLQVQAQVSADASTARVLLKSVNVPTLGELTNQIDKLTAECNK